MDLIAGLKLSSLLVLAAVLVLAVKKPSLLLSHLGSQQESPIMVAQGVDTEYLEEWCKKQHMRRDLERASQIELYYRRQLNGRLATIEAQHIESIKRIEEQYQAIRSDITDIRKYLLEKK